MLTASCRVRGTAASQHDDDTQHRCRPMTDCCDGHGMTYDERRGHSRHPACPCRFRLLGHGSRPASVGEDAGTAGQGCNIEQHYVNESFPDHLWEQECATQARVASKMLGTRVEIPGAAFLAVPLHPLSHRSRHCSTRSSRELPEADFSRQKCPACKARPVANPWMISQTNQTITDSDVACSRLKSA